MKLTFLGTGTSQGVPLIGCQCPVCTSQDRRDNRLRTSAMVEVGDRRIVIDAGPDFRQQMLREGVAHLDAILLTHEHKDHTAGIDDVRAFNFVDYPTIHTMHIYGNAPTIATLLKDFDYAFAKDKYRGVPVIELHTIDEQHPFDVCGVLRERMNDSTTLHLIRSFLKAGVMENGFVSPSIEGVPQGGPLSPLLSNIYLDKLDKELEYRGLRFVRYADDFNIFVKSKDSAKRVKESVSSWLERKLFLRVNIEKTKIVRPKDSEFLGFGFWKKGEI